MNRRELLKALIFAAPVAAAVPESTAVARHIESFSGAEMFAFVNGQKVRFYLDGHDVAEVVVPHIPAVIRRQGLV